MTVALLGVGDPEDRGELAEQRGFGQLEVAWLHRGFEVLRLARARPTHHQAPDPAKDVVTLNVLSSAAVTVPVPSQRK